jgi:hypothetical protein
MNFIEISVERTLLITVLHHHALPAAIRTPSHTLYLFSLAISFKSFKAITGSYNPGSLKEITALKHAVLYTP